MKKIQILFTLLLLSAVTFAQKAVKNHPKLAETAVLPTKPVTPQILKEISNGNAYLVDVRSNEEFQKIHLKHAQNIDVKSPDFLKNIAQLDKRKPIYLYCRAGHRSGLATDSLLNLGYTNVYNIGGLDSLVNKGFAKK